MTLETQISALIKETTALLQSYTQQAGMVAKLTTDLATAKKKIESLEKYVTESSLYDEMIFLLNPASIPGMGRSDADMAAFTFDQDSSYQPKVRVNGAEIECYRDLFENEDQFKFLRDIIKPSSPFIVELHLLCAVGEKPSEKSKTNIIVLRKNNTPATQNPNGELYDATPANPNILRNKDGKFFFTVDGYGAKPPEAKSIVRNVLRIKDYMLGSNWGNIRIINAGANKVHIFGVGIVVKPFVGE